MIIRPVYPILILAAVLTACASTKPPAPVSELRQSAQRDMDSGHASYEHRNWTAAAFAFSRAADKFGAMDDDASQATALVNAGNAVLQAGGVTEAETMFKSAQEVAGRDTAETTRTVAATALAGQARCQAQAGHHAEAKRLLEQALTCTPTDTATTATLQNELAVILMHLNDPKAVELLQTALATNTALGRNRDVAVNRLNLGRYYLRQKQHPELAKPDLEIALAEFKKLDDPVGLSRAHESLADYYTATGNADLAKFHRAQALQKYQFLKDEAGIERMSGDKK